MDRVNIYLHTTIHGPRKQNGVGGYILECERYPHPATLTKFVELENESESSAEVSILAASLKRINKPCELRIFTDCQYLQSALTSWLEGWKQSDFQNAKGDLIQNAEKWREIAERLNGSEKVFFRQNHEYANYLEREAERRKNESS